MAIFGMKDASNITLLEKASKKVAMYIDYANATTSEWSSDRVYATKKGANAIAWDTNRAGKLTLESELFDLKLLAMTVGSGLDQGSADIFRRETFTLDSSKAFKLESVPKSDSVSVFKLKEDGVEHDGSEIPQKITGDAGSVPVMVTDVAVTAKDTSADITWSAPNGANSYVVYRDGVQIGQPTTTSFSDSDLVAETQYKYTVTAINGNGQSPVSAEVVITTAAAGTSTAGAVVKATDEAVAIATAAANAAGESGLSFTVGEGGAIQLSDEAIVGADYVVYYVASVTGVTTVTVGADTFAPAFEIYGDAYIRDQQSGKDSFIQLHYFNARPQSNFTLTQSAKEPTSLSIVFDLFPNDKNDLATYKIIE
ncbi:fibronectin type III domain-containing protein [Liquorilactobacillus mali]|uniref:Cellulose-binding family II n=1 Tax=Liquorilactobacillus mali KCTC 3596 = DSM 20444 TaxID=1046596 RepID=J0KWV2_9LACO|nr:fibronectin type III domain-containing protein [Liquorilactobacillus mali]EJE97759.1 cellulose-binding family II [Liquorilactobacillus mali KCTC 3596 = DSM 20444]KRN10830.1 cellulose-binding family II [Liquorilactobacillus mali KCTC 3596 = DSM 20444]